MFDVIRLMFSWLPAPLDAIAFGVVCLVFIFALIKLIAAIIDLLPFT